MFYILTFQIAMVQFIRILFLGLFIQNQLQNLQIELILHSIGNSIDKHLRDMAYGQTNGIPQGSVLMDFIAEMVLGFADLEISIRIQQANIQDYEIIRYRDDYQNIF